MPVTSAFNRMFGLHNITSQRGYVWLTQHNLSARLLLMMMMYFFQQYPLHWTVIQWLRTPCQWSKKQRSESTKCCLKESGGTAYRAHSLSSQPIDLVSEDQQWQRAGLL